MTEVFLGRDGCDFDEIVTEYLLMDRCLYLRSSYDGRTLPVEPDQALADLDRMAAVSREMAEICARQGGSAGDYPVRARACELAAGKIREAFGLLPNHCTPPRRGGQGETMTVTKTRLGDVGTAHVWFTSVGSPAGFDLLAEAGEPLALPSESWWDLEGILSGNKWEWDGEGRPADFRGNTVQRVVAFVP